MGKVSFKKKPKKTWRRSPYKKVTTGFFKDLKGWRDFPDTEPTKEILDEYWKERKNPDRSIDMDEYYFGKPEIGKTKTPMKSQKWHKPGPKPGKAKKKKLEDIMDIFTQG